jgi:hypothetical protein
MVLTPFQGRVALPSALHFQLPSGCQECDAAVSRRADSPPVSLLTPDFPRIKSLLENSGGIRLIWCWRVVGELVRAAAAGMVGGLSGSAIAPGCRRVAGQ